MIVGRGTSDDGKQVILLGLSDDNVQRLTDGKPILVTRETHGAGVPEGWIITIVHGKTEQSLAAQLVKGVAKNAKIHHEPKLGDAKKGT